MQDIANMIEAIEEDEPNSLEVTISANMSPAEVVEEILRQIGEMEVDI